MTLKGIRNVAFVGMIIGAVCFAGTRVQAEFKCQNCVGNTCTAAGDGEGGWTECGGINCAVWGNPCSG